MLIRGKIEPEVLSYAACALECEGSLTLSRGVHSNKKTVMHNPCIAIANTDMRLIQFLQDTFGGSVYSEQPKKLSKKVIYRWKLWCNPCIEFLKLVFPYLKFKYTQAEVLIEFWERKRSLSFTERDVYWNRIKDLNKGKSPAETKRENSETNLRSDSPTLVETPVS